MDVLALFGMSVFFFALVGWVIWMVVNASRRNKATKAQVELQAKLLEKFGSSRELVEYLQTDAAQRFLDSVTVERGTPYGRILGSIQVGLILALLGVGFLFVRGHIPGGQQGLLVVGTVALVLGLGFLVSAGACYVLSKSWGLLEGKGSSRR